MATIITVHGTGATGPQEGDKWWQKGSEFERHIRELVETEDGELNIPSPGMDRELTGIPEIDRELIELYKAWE